jgi:5S rRNA maturation endonuclease (ribonuclease M5)
VQDSIYYYKHGQFKHFIQRIDNQSIRVSDALATFREVKCLNKGFGDMPIQELTNKPDLIVKLSKALRAGMKSESKFKLPYNKEERELELIENIAENYAIDTNKAKAKVVTGHYKDDNTGQEFNYALEVVLAPRTDMGVRDAGRIDIIGNVNSTPSIDGGEKYFDGSYAWQDKKHKWITSSGIRGILHECGFNSSGYVSDAKKKVSSVLYINLNTPCPDWLGSAGKTHIDLRPYVNDIAKTVSSLAYKMPSYHGQGYGWSNESCGDTEDSAKSYLEDFLRDRYAAVKADPELKIRDRLTQSGVWYRIRPKMIKAGFTPRKDWGTTRQSLQNSISKVCTELFGEDLKREDLGIIAGARAIMLYDGEAYPVTVDNLEELAGKGIGVIVIEKSGIADILKKYAEEYGIALIHTQGRLTEYTKDLIDVATSPIATLTDYDAYGIEIAKATRNEIPRVGIDMETIAWLQQNGYPDLKQEAVEEAYSPDIRTNNEYLKTHRIELDSIVAAVGGEGLWEYIKYKFQLIGQEKGFDYNNIITRPEPEKLYPETISNLIFKLSEYMERIVENDWEAIEQRLTGARELISIKEQVVNNVDVLSKKVEEDEIMQEEIIPKIEKFLEDLSDLLN